MEANVETKKKNYINHVRLDEPKRGVLFSDFVKSVISKKVRRQKESYRRNYITLLHQLKKFCAEKDVELFTESINEEFLEDFIIFLEDQNLKKTYIKMIIDNTKAIVRKAAVYGYAIDATYDDVVIDSEEIPSVYLSPNEIARIYYYQGLTKKQQRIRDLFVVGCYTALRYSDLNSLKKEDLKDGFIYKLTKKSNTRVVIPVHDFVNEIYEKYGGNFPNGISGQHFNRYIKLICQKIGIKDEVTITYTRGGRVVTETKQKWELISTHTARRSGATNLMNTKRMSIDEIRRITGHNTEKSFLRYVKTTKEENARHLAGDYFFRK